jgi:hypothetical protein
MLQVNKINLSSRITFQNTGSAAYFVGNTIHLACDITHLHADIKVSPFQKVTPFSLPSAFRKFKTLGKCVFVIIANYHATQNSKLLTQN